MTTQHIPELQTLFAATCYLMTRYAQQQQAEGALTCRTFSLAQAVHQHLAMILQHPALVHGSEAKRAYVSLAQQWHNTVHEHYHSAQCSCEKPNEQEKSAELAYTASHTNHHTLH
jgi:hypothetical protein